MGRLITKCCPSCGSTNISHYGRCKIHLTDVKEYNKLKNPPKEVVVHKGLIEKIDIKKMFIEYQNKKDKYGMTVFDYDPPIKEVMIEFGTLVKKSLIEEEKKSGE